jgi:Clp amino terminal domain, pathogenicity island component
VTRSALPANQSTPRTESDAHVTKHSKPADAWNPWSTYIDASEEARRGGDRRVGTEHLILGLLREPAVAQALGCDLRTARDTLDAMDHNALAAVGIGAAFNAPSIPIDEPTKLSSAIAPGSSVLPAGCRCDGGRPAAVIAVKRVKPAARLDRAPRLQHSCRHGGRAEPAMGSS